jgi:Na+-transporting NADH:ubiquinone oxidoreductase subunit NqrB
MSIPPGNPTSPWSQWKKSLWENLRIASVAACLEAGALFIFLYIIVQDWHFLWTTTGGALVVFWFFNVAVSALGAYLKSNSKIATGELADR